MQAIHRAAYDGDVEEVEQLVAENSRWLDAPVQGEGEELDGRKVEGCTPLMLAAYKGHDTAVARLLSLGAGVRRVDADNWSAAHWTCLGGDRPAILGRLLDAGAATDARTDDGCTPLMRAALHGRLQCVGLLIDRCYIALDLHVKDAWGRTALLLASHRKHPGVIQLLLQAGADPTIRSADGQTALDLTKQYQQYQCIALLEAAKAEPQRTRALFKVRALLDAAHATTKARRDARSKGLPPPAQQQAAEAAAPMYLKGRVERGEALPLVFLVRKELEVLGGNVDAGEQRAIGALFASMDAAQEQVAACVKYALGIEGGGGWHEGEDPPPQGMLPEVFVELLEMLVPRWDPARKGEALGEKLE